MDIDTVFAHNLEAVRLATGYTHENLAHDADVARSTIWNLKSGATSATLEMAAKLAKVLEIEPWLLLHPDLAVEQAEEGQTSTLTMEDGIPRLRLARTQTSKRALRP